MEWLKYTGNKYFENKEKPESPHIAGGDVNDRCFRNQFRKMPLKLLCHQADPHIVTEMKSSGEMKLYANVCAEFLVILFRTNQS